MGYIKRLFVGLIAAFFVGVFTGFFLPCVLIVSAFLIAMICLIIAVLILIASILNLWPILDRIFENDPDTIDNLDRGDLY